MFLTEQRGGTEIRTKTHAEVFGRLGSFGLSVMKTKADRMWEEFGANLAAILRQGALPAGSPARAAVSSASAAHATARFRAAPAQAAVSAPNPKPAKSKWWTRLAGSGKQEGDSMRDLRLATDIYLEVHRGNDIIKILWPAQKSQGAARWLKEIIRD